MTHAASRQSRSEHSPRALWQVELAKMLGGCYLCGTGGMLLAVSIAFSDRTESQ